MIVSLPILALTVLTVTFIWSLNVFLINAELCKKILAQEKHLFEQQQFINELEYKQQLDEQLRFITKLNNFQQNLNLIHNPVEKPVLH